MVHPKLFLEFYENFPSDNLRGQMIELDPVTKSGKNSDAYWIFGTISYSDIRALPPEESEDLFHYRAISRIHFTLKWDCRTKLFMILEGGVYQRDPTDTSPGEHGVVRPSSNGTWLNGERLLENDWATIYPGDQIHLGNDKKIIVHDNEHPTYDQNKWRPEFWRLGGYKQKSGIPVKEAEELAEHAKTNATGGWQLANNIFTWLISPSNNRWEQFIKIMVASSGITVAYSTEFRQFVNWLFNR